MIAAERDRATGIVQLPLPRHLMTTHASFLVDPDKDADGFASSSASANSVLGESDPLPCTPRGIVRTAPATISR